MVARMDGQRRTAAKAEHRDGAAAAQPVGCLLHVLPAQLPRQPADIFPFQGNEPLGGLQRVGALFLPVGAVQVVGDDPAQPLPQVIEASETDLGRKADDGSLAHTGGPGQFLGGEKGRIPVRGDQVVAQDLFGAACPRLPEAGQPPQEVALVAVRRSRGRYRLRLHRKGGHLLWPAPAETAGRGPSKSDGSFRRWPPTALRAAGPQRRAARSLRPRGVRISSSLRRKKSMMTASSAVGTAPYHTSGGTRRSMPWTMAVPKPPAPISPAMTAT